MKQASKRHSKGLRPKHKQTKEYLKHYYPFIPLFVSIAALLMVVLSPVLSKRNEVLAYASDLNIQTLLKSTNIARQDSQAKALAINPILNAAAQAKADDMVKRNYWSHITPDGKEPWSFIATAGYDYAKAGENLAYGFDSANQVIDGWMNSTSHRRNILDRSYSEVGFGIASSPNFNRNGPETVIVAMYALPTNQFIAQASNNQALLGEAGRVRNIQLYSSASWITYLIGAIMGAGIMYLSITHSLTIKRMVTKGEKFIIRNPILDSVIITMITVGILLLRTAGSIH